MEKLTYEQTIVLKAVGNSSGNIKDVYSEAKGSIAITQPEIDSLLQSLLKIKLVTNKDSDEWKITTRAKKVAQFNKPSSKVRENKTHQKKDITMKKSLATSIEMLRSKLETKPPQPIEQYQDKIDVLTALIDLPEIEEPLSLILKEIKNDLQALEKAATDAKALSAA